MDIKLVTHSDLQNLKEELLNSIKELLSQVQYNKKTWLRNADVQKMLGLSSSGLQNLRISGVLPYSKINGTIFYLKQDIENLLEKNKRNNQTNF